MRGYRDRDVVLDVAELRLRNALAQTPERARLLAALREHGLVTVERFRDPFVQVLGGAAVAELGEDVPGMRCAERIASIRQVREHGFQAGARHQLESGDAIADAAAQRREQLDRLCRAGDRDPRRGARRGLRVQAQHGCGDHAERAFGAEEELLQVVAGVVLAQAAQPIPHPAVGQHHFHAEHLLARGSIAQHVDPAGVGRKVAADLAAAFGGERERKQAPGVRRRGLHRGEHAAGLHRRRIVEEVEAADAVHASEREHDLAPRPRGHRAADQAGVAALRHHRQALARAQGDHLRDLFGASRAYHAFGRAAVLLAPVRKVRFRVRSRGEHVRRTYNIGEALLQSHP